MSRCAGWPRCAGWLLVLVVWWAGQAQAQTAEELVRLGHYGHWTVLAHPASGLCFLDSTPVGSGRSAGAPRVSKAQVTRYPDRPNQPEVGIKIGFFLGANRLVTVNIDDRHFHNLYSDGEHAWPGRSEEDRKLIQHMRRGRVMRVSAATLTGQLIHDTYSLSGFTRAMRRLRGCKP